VKYRISRRKYDPLSVPRVRKAVEGEKQRLFKTKVVMVDGNVEVTGGG
jgi:hypothetical protein